MNNNLHIIWDMDGTLIDSGPEIYSTIEKCLSRLGVSMNEMHNPLRIGPPIKDILRNSFTEEIISNSLLDKAVQLFREIYDTSDYIETNPFTGIDEILKCKDYTHHVITNKPYLAANRIIEKKGWNQYIVDVLTPQYREQEIGRPLKKQELFSLYKEKYPSVKTIAIGDMPIDIISATSVGISSIGVLWGEGSKDELIASNCKYLVENTCELTNCLKEYAKY